MTCRDVQWSALREAKKVGRSIGRYFRAASDTLLALSEMASREGGLPTSSAHPRTHDRQILDNCLLRLGDLLAFGSPLLGHTCIWTVTDRIRCREARALPFSRETWRTDHFPSLSSLSRLDSIYQQDRSHCSHYLVCVVAVLQSSPNVRPSSRSTSTEQPADARRVSAHLAIRSFHNPHTRLSSFPSEYSTLTTGNDASRANLSKEFGSTANLAEGPYDYQLDVLSPTGEYERHLQSDRKRTPWLAFWRGEGMGWKRRRVVGPLVGLGILIIVLAVAVPTAISARNKHDASLLSTSPGDAVSSSSSSTPTATTRSLPSPSVAPTPLTAVEQVDLIKSRRRTGFAQGVDLWRFDSSPSWIDSQKADGSWPDVNYLAGCQAQRANWPAQEHLQRTLALAALQSGEAFQNVTAGLQVQNVKNSALDALNWWFANDFGSNVDCVARGGNL